ncbi:hypothetical protein SAMN02799636_04305 [Methylobacterium sp. 275MFSha3.1]|uniref:hypothetical protein n=1 Tax=Methylobacterium sp. 275MFSha3.1 TaxID=1502746 RepID=UPI0008A77CA4|nr:hypothetical protein [Methylobacterium sp. 275MFSha3.1]SEH89010.1 hypothetical protein SAMN02799636_04305 [Methylobacterium sp. 275MFSha3.1]
MPDTARQLRRPRPFDGSTLETACLLDAACPGFLNRVFYASNLRRAPIFGALAEIKLDGITEVVSRLRPFAPALCYPDLDVWAQAARALLSLRSREIVQAIYGSVPDGYLGLLARIGADPLPRGVYRLAHGLYADPGQRVRAKLLRQSPGRVTADMIEVAARLDPVLLHRNVLVRVRNVGHVETMHAALALIRALVPQANDEALHRSLDGLRPSDKDMAAWIERWLRRATRVPYAPPIPANDPDLRVLNGTDLVCLGRRFHNCGADRVGHLAAGLRCYVEWTGNGGPAVVELRRLSGDHFLIEDLRGPKNSDLDPDLAERIRAKLSTYGVLSPIGVPPTISGSALLNLLGVWIGEEGEADPFLADLLKEAA